MDEQIDHLRSVIESIITGINNKEYNVQVAAGAIIDVLREEGLIGVNTKSTFEEKGE